MPGKLPSRLLTLPSKRSVQSPWPCQGKLARLLGRVVPAPGASAAQRERDPALLAPSKQRWSPARADSPAQVRQQHAASTWHTRGQLQGAGGLGTHGSPQKRHRLIASQDQTMSACTLLACRAPLASLEEQAGIPPTTPTLGWAGRQCPPLLLSPGRDVVSTALNQPHVHLMA